ATAEAPAEGEPADHSIVRGSGPEDFIGFCHLPAVCEAITPPPMQEVAAVNPSTPDLHTERADENRRDKEK
ncbi:hypothetical protein AVEN_73297-1, partial [Araneus ventricosus]